MGNENSKTQSGFHPHKNKTPHSHQNVEVDNFFKWMESSQHGLNFDTILEYFSQSKIIQMILSQNAMDHSKTHLNPEKLKKIFNSLIEMQTTTSIIDTYAELLFHGRLDYDQLYNIVYDCFNTSYRLVGYQEIDVSMYSKTTLKNIVTSMLENGQSIDKFQFKDWTIQEFPNLFFGFHSFFFKRIKDLKFENEQSTVTEPASDLSMFMNLALIWYLIFNLPGCYTKNLSTESGTILEKFKNCCKEKRWKKLYNSEENGLSLNRFQSSLFNYKASTIMLIYCQSGYLYCIGSNCEYKQSPTAYGDDQTRIMRLWPSFKNYDVSSEKNIFLNTKSRNLEQGLIFGYNQLKPVLKLDDSLQHIVHDGAKDDSIISVEAWGCGTAKEANYQADLKKWEAKNIEKMRTAKPSENWGQDNADKNILELAGRTTEHSQRGDI